VISQGLVPASRRIAWKIHPPVLALGGGGARGFAHIGVLRELDRADLPIRSIVGCSMGALVGGMYATLGSADAVFDRWREALDRGLIPDPPSHNRSRGRGRKEHPILQAARRFRDRLIVSFALQQPTVLADDEIAEAVDFLVPDVPIEDLPLRFSAVATDLESGDAVILEAGSLKTAVRASGAIPGILPAVTVDGRNLVDGGVVAEVPVLEARRVGRPVLAVDVSMDLGEPSEDDIALDTMMRTQAIAAALLRRSQLRHARWVVRPDVGDRQWSEWQAFEELVETGAREMRRWLGTSRPEGDTPHRPADSEV